MEQLTQMVANMTVEEACDQEFQKKFFKAVKVADLSPLETIKALNQFEEKATALDDNFDSEKFHEAFDSFVDNAQEELDKETKATLSQVKKVSDFVSDAPIAVDLVIPPGYHLDKERGIQKLEYRKGKEDPNDLSPYIVLPCEIVVDPSDKSGDKLVRLTKWNQTEGRWEYHPFPVSMGKITSAKDIGVLNKAGIIIIPDDLRGQIARYMSDLANANNVFKSLPVNKAISHCGWTSDGLFFPYTTKDRGESLIFSGEQGTTSYAIHATVEKLPRGEKSTAQEILAELQGNPVFGIVLAGVLASPLVPKLSGIIDENIGIEVYGRSSKGKTTIQTLTATLVYGLGEELKSTWAKAREAGIWRKAEAVNNLPLILDDSHRITEKLQGVPHDLLNGKEGEKSTETTKGWDSKDGTQPQYRGVILFNGEVSINVKAPADSVGIYGRTIMISEAPFPPEYDGTRVEELKRKTLLNGGHFAEPWIRHLASLDNEQTVQAILEIKNEFMVQDAVELYQRLATKAAVLVWALQEFNRLFDTSVNIESVKELLKKSMLTETNNVNVADKIMQKIIDDVWAEISEIKPNSKGYTVYNYGNRVDISGKADLFFKSGECLVMKNSVLEEVMKGTAFGTNQYIRKQLAIAGYLQADAKGDMKEYRYSTEEGNRKMYGLNFPFEMFSKFLPDSEVEGDEQGKGLRLAPEPPSKEDSVQLPPIE
ncbi:DUF927 domain-containing protein [Brevibacillus panacihumi]|uniref:DUF927 domain-containing protein n=1 Tax=Brevibacillus panacihumi TaxID=497735 RepID=UPI003CFED4DB